MRKLSSTYILLTMLLLTLQGCFDSDNSLSKEERAIKEAEDEAIAVNERQTETFNQLDAEATAAEYNYPFLRLDLGQVQVFETLELYRNINELIVFPGLAADNWDHSAWDDLKVVQSGPSKVHVAGRFSRINTNGEIYASSDTLRIVTDQDGHWGIKVSSSYIQSEISNDNNISSEDVLAAETAAIGVAENYLAALNSRDTELLADYFHYPNVLLPGVDLRIMEMPEEYINYVANTVFANLDRSEWDHSEIVSTEIVQSSNEKVHLALSYENINTVGKVLGTEEGIWVIVLEEGKWAIQAQSML